MERLNERNYYVIYIMNGLLDISVLHLYLPILGFCSFFFFLSFFFFFFFFYGAGFFVCLVLIKYVVCAVSVERVQHFEPLVGCSQRSRIQRSRNVFIMIITVIL